MSRAVLLRAARLSAGQMPMIGGYNMAVPSAGWILGSVCGDIASGYMGGMR